MVEIYAARKQNKLERTKIQKNCGHFEVSAGRNDGESEGGRRVELARIIGTVGRA
jgi:hypothetical protein